MDGAKRRRPRNHPLLKPLNLPPLGNPGRSAPLLTKTLLFVGEGDPVMVRAGTRLPPQMPHSIAPGAGGRKFRAFDKATGAVLWETELPAGTTGAPMTYMYEGKQFIVVAIGGLEHPQEFITSCPAAHGERTNAFRADRLHAPAVAPSLRHPRRRPRARSCPAATRPSSSRPVLDLPAPALLRRHARHEGRAARRRFLPMLTLPTTRSAQAMFGKLRQALGDNAATPQFIKTVARRGHRFIAAVICVDRLQF